MSEDRKCPNCGRAIPIDARLCPYCGKKFDETVITSEKKHTGFGIASLVLGIIAICLVWTPLIGYYDYGPAIWVLVLLPLGILSVIFGCLSYWRKKIHDNYGLTGFILGMIAIILGFIFSIISASYYI